MSDKSTSPDSGSGPKDSETKLSSISTTQQNSSSKNYNDDDSATIKNQSKFWKKYIEQQKQQKKLSPNSPYNDSSNKISPYSSSSSSDNELKKKQQYDQIKIKPNNKVLSSSVAEKKKKDAQVKLKNTSNLLLLLLVTEKRIQGRPNHLTYIVSMKSNTDPDKKNYYILCLLLNQCLLGGLGGVIVGFQTKFLSPNRFPSPNLPIPSSWNLPATRQAAELFIKANSVLWRSSKRAVISGIMFDNFDREIEQYRNKRDWKNTAIAGSICGSFFGLRGGFHGPLHSALSFGLIGALGGYFFVNPPKDDKFDKNNNGIGNKTKRWSS